MGFRVDDFGNGICGAAPREGAGTTYPYLRLHRVADAQTDFTDRAVWSVLRDFPPVEDTDPQVAKDRSLGWAAEVKGRLEGTTYGDVAALNIASFAHGRGGQFAEFWETHGHGLFSNSPQGSLWYVTADKLLLHRAAFVRTQLALQLTPDLSLSPNREEYEGLRAFTSLAISEGVEVGTLLIPALLAFSPAVSGFVLNALPHTLVFMPGEFVGLTEEWPARLSQLFEPGRVLSHGPAESYDQFHKGATPHDCAALLGWWIDRLNVVFSYALDPTRFTDQLGNHDAAAQTAWLTTVERMLADGIVILGQPDLTALVRTSTAFDLLDKAEALLGWGRDEPGKGFKALLRRKKALPRLQAGFANLPDGLNYRFASHVEELYNGLYDGVLSNAMPHRRTPAGMRVALDESDTLEAMSEDDYVAAVCRGVRNTSHGLLDVLQSSPYRFSLATNNCAIPRELASLATMVMFALMADAESLCEGSLGRDFRQ